MLEDDKVQGCKNPVRHVRSEFSVIFYECNMLGSVTWSGICFGRKGSAMGKN